MVCASWCEWVNCLSIFLVPYRSFSTPFYPQSATSQGACPNSLLFRCFRLRLTFEPIKELGSTLDPFLILYKIDAKCALKLQNYAIFMLEFKCKFLASIWINTSKFRILGNHFGGRNISCYTFSKDRNYLFCNIFQLFLHLPLDFVFIFKQHITFLLIKVRIIIIREPKKSFQLFTWLFFLINWPLEFESKLYRVIQEWSCNLALLFTFVFVSVAPFSIHKNT